MNTVRTLALAVTLTGALAAAAGAQATDPALRSNTSGFNLGLFAGASSIELEGNRDDFSPGMGLQFGYGFSRNASVFTRGSLAESGVAHLDLGLRYSAGGTSWALRPFALGALNASFDDYLDTNGRAFGFTAGGGLEYFVTPTVAIDAGILYSFATSTQIRAGGHWEDASIDASSTRIEIGVTLHQ